VKIRVSPADTYTVVHLEGTLDEDTKFAFDEHVHPLIEAAHDNAAYRRLLIDLGGAPRISSAGAGVLVTLVGRANIKGVRVVLFNATPFVDSIFRASKLTKFFDLAGTQDEALELLDSL
jgi:anti-anti-sigma factor